MKNKKKKEITKFISKLYFIVNDSSTDNIIKWNLTNDGFIITNFEKFCYGILPKYFNTNLFSSFNRQLNLYDFVKTSVTEYEYSNPYFKRGKIDNLYKIKRKKNKNLISCSKLRRGIREMIKTIIELNQRIQILEGKHEFLDYCYNDLSHKNSILEHQLFVVNEREKNIEKLFFSIITHISPMFKYFETLFNSAVRMNNSNCIWLKEAFIQIINNALSCYMPDNINPFDTPAIPNSYNTNTNDYLQTNFDSISEEGNSSINNSHNHSFINKKKAIDSFGNN